MTPRTPLSAQKATTLRRLVSRSNHRAGSNRTADNTVHLRGRSRAAASGHSLQKNCEIDRATVASSPDHGDELRSQRTTLLKRFPLQGRPAQLDREIPTPESRSDPM